MLVPVRPLTRSFIFLLACVVLIYSIKDCVFELLTTLSNFTKEHYISSKQHVPHKNASKRELLLLQMLFRHGHRAPFMLYPTDPNNASFWKEGLGTLTKIGRLQHYRLGSYLQNRYKYFITTNPKEVELVSAESSRTQHGAYSFLAGLYAPKKEYRFTKDLKWQPVISKNSNNYKNILTRTYCPRNEKEYRLLKKSKLAKKTRRRFDKLYRYWSIHSGRLINDWHLANDLQKTFACEEKYNLTVPDWAYTYWDELKLQTALNYYFHYGTKELLRYRIGPLIGFMIDNMKRRLKEIDTKKRVFVYSAHGSFLAQTLMVLNRYNWAEPPPASTIVLELWKENGKDYTVRWLYFNSTSPEVTIDAPYVLTFGDCGGEYCPFTKFVKKVKNFIPDDYEGECNDTTANFFKPLDLISHIPTSSHPEDLSLSFITLLLLVILLFILMNYLSS